MNCPSCRKITPGPARHEFCGKCLDEIEKEASRRVNSKVKWNGRWLKTANHVPAILVKQLAQLAKAKGGSP